MSACGIYPIFRIRLKSLIRPTSLVSLVANCAISCCKQEILIFLSARGNALKKSSSKSSETLVKLTFSVLMKSFKESALYFIISKPVKILFNAVAVDSLIILRAAEAGPDILTLPGFSIPSCVTFAIILLNSAVATYSFCGLNTSENSFEIDLAFSDCGHR